MKIDRDFVKTLNKMTLQSSLYHKLNEGRHRNQKGYIEWDTVIFDIARLGLSYQSYPIPFFERDFSHRNALIILNQAYHLGFSSFWLGEKPDGGTRC